MGNVTEKGCDDRHDALEKEIEAMKKVDRTLETRQAKGVSWTIFWGIIILLTSILLGVTGVIWGEVGRNRETTSTNARAVSANTARHEETQRALAEIRDGQKEMNRKIDRLLEAK